MSEATGKALLALLFLAALLGAGFNIGESRGENRMKRWQDQWYAAHPVVKEVRGLCADKDSPGESICYRTDGSTFHLDWDGVVRIGALSHGCSPGTVANVVLGHCAARTPANILETAPKPQKGSKRLPTLDESFRSMNKNLNEIDATIDRLGADFGLRWSKRQQTWVPIPEKEPAPLSKCDCKDYGMGLICTCPAEADLIHFSGTAGVPAEKPQ